MIIISVCIGVGFFSFLFFFPSTDYVWMKNNARKTSYLKKLHLSIYSYRGKKRPNNPARKSTGNTKLSWNNATLASPPRIKLGTIEEFSKNELTIHPHSKATIEFPHACGIVSGEVGIFWYAGRSVPEIDSTLAACRATNLLASRR